MSGVTYAGGVLVPASGKHKKYRRWIFCSGRAGVVVVAVVLSGVEKSIVAQIRKKIERKPSTLALTCWLSLVQADMCQNKGAANRC